MHTGYRAKMILHSRSEVGAEAYTMELTYPRFIHAEVMTHRDRARNAGSSRAIPIPKYLVSVIRHPAEPAHWGQNQKGMQAEHELSGWRKWLARKLWRGARYPAVAFAWLLWKLGAHKQVVNRIVEPWTWITTIMTFTGQAVPNFFGLRAHPDADPSFQKIAYMALAEVMNSVPQELGIGQWHLPYVTAEEREWVKRFNPNTGGWEPLNPIYSDLQLKMMSTARCCRVSVVPPGSVKPDPKKDFDTYNKLLFPPTGKREEWNPGDPRHVSPFEHVLMAVADPNYRSGPMVGFKQHRKEIEGETITSMPVRLVGPEGWQ